MTDCGWWPYPRWISAASLAMVLAGVSSAWGQEELERMAMTRLRLSTDAAVAAGCTRVGQVSDDSVKDLRRKIVRAGGNTAVLSFGTADLSQIYADVFRCDGIPAAAPTTGLPPGTPPPPPGVPPRPLGIPPPPPGPPPPPPPGPSR
jgi:hypothetical protein